MKKYRVTEVFRSVQGEGPSVGRDAIFVRFQGCNHDCPFCDEWHKTDWKEYSAEELVWLVQNEIADGPKPDRIVFTGGEPMLQVDEHLCQHFLDFTSASLAIETNGSVNECETSKLLSRYFTDIVVSPKYAESANPFTQAMNHATAVKVLVPLPNDIAMATLVQLEKGIHESVQLYLQPETPRGHIGESFKANVDAARELQLVLGMTSGRVRWRLLPQVHVWMELK